MIYITGDVHRDFAKIYDFAEEHNTTKDDILIILGDAGINYYGNDKGDLKLKKRLRNLPLTLFIVRGNHEMDPKNLPTYKDDKFLGGVVYKEAGFDNLIFAKDGESYTFKNKGIKKTVFVMGGAYSVDKYFRLERGMQWFSDEQIDEKTKSHGINTLKKLKYKVDIVLTHTCPYKYRPIEVFLPFIDQSKVDVSVELFLDLIEDKLTYDKWYCGHYHTDKKDGKLTILFHDIVEFF